MQKVYSYYGQYAISDIDLVVLDNSAYLRPIGYIQRSEPFRIIRTVYHYHGAKLLYFVQNKDGLHGFILIEDILNHATIIPSQNQEVLAEKNTIE